MKAKVAIPIVAVIALMLYLLSIRSSSEESFPIPNPSEIETSDQIVENEKLIQADVETSPETESTSERPLVRYDPKKDPLYSQKAKQTYYDRLATHYSWTQGEDLIPNILKDFSGNEAEVRKAIGQSERFEIYAAVPYLKEIIQNPDDPNFRLALGALVFFDEDAGYSYAIEQMKGKDALRWTSIYLRAIINRNKTEYIDALYEVIKEKSPAHRIIAGALSRMGEDIASTEIIERLPAKNASWTGLEALANTKDAKWAPSLKEHYENSTNLGSRLYSAYALLKLGYSEYREPIVSSVLELGTIPPMDSDAFRDLVKEKGRITDYGINDMFLALELLEKIEQPDALEILAQVATRAAETNSPISEHALALIAKNQSEESLEILLELTEAGVVPFSPIRAKLFALYQTEAAEQHMESVLAPWEIEKYLIVAETKGWRGFFRDPRVH